MTIFINKTEDVQNKLDYLNFISTNRTVRIRIGYLSYTLSAYIADCFDEEGDIDVERRFRLSGADSIDTNDIFEIYYILERRIDAWQKRRASGSGQLRFL